MFESSTKVKTAAIITLVMNLVFTGLTQAVELELLPAASIGGVSALLTFLGSRQIPENNPAGSAMEVFKKRLEAYQAAQDAEAWRAHQAEASGRGAPVEPRRRDNLSVTKPPEPGEWK